MANPANRPTKIYWTAAARRDLLDLAVRERPREAAALLGGPSREGPVDTVLQLVNDATQADRFAANPVSFAAREHELRTNGRRALGFAHSHPEGTTNPSERDRTELWTGCVQAITDGREVRAFWLDEARTVHPLAVLEAIL